MIELRVVEGRVKAATSDGIVELPAVEIVRHATASGLVDSLGVVDGVQLSLDYTDVIIVLSISSEGCSPRIDLSSPYSLARVQRVPPQDHELVDSIWHPLRKNVHDALCEVFGGAGASLPKRLGLEGYLKLAGHPALIGRIRIEGAEAIDLASALTVAEQDAEPKADAPITVKPHPYQSTGVRWMRRLEALGLGGILGDEMGLGKTLQVIAYLALRRSTGPLQVLIVVPASLLENWKRELIRFAPQLSWLVHRGPARLENRKRFKQFDITITSYDVLARDAVWLAKESWTHIVCDEAHNLRNPQTQRFSAVQMVRRSCPGAHCIAMTGTPIQNSLRDAWALFEFVTPNRAGSAEEFARRYDDTVSGARELELRLSPFMLRRRIKDVGMELPELIFSPEAIQMPSREAMEYEALRKELTADPSMTLAAIVKLRQACCHALLLESDCDCKTRSIYPNAKLARTIEILGQLDESDDKCLIFTSFLKMSVILLRKCREMGLWAEEINGGIPVEERQQLIDAFSGHKGPAVLVLNPQAAGVGLNIQAANRVIHYNLEWNPSVEEQATGRAYRLGQKRNVVVHRLYYVDTIEEVIDARVELKRALITHAVKGVNGSEDGGDLLLALSMSPKRDDLEDVIV